MSNKRVTSMEVLRYVHELARVPLVMATGNNGLSMDIVIDGLQPINISKPTIVLRHTAGRSGDVQEGVVTVLMYSMPYLSSKDGRKMPNTNKIGAYERAAQDWVESLPTGEYLFWSDDTIQTDYDPEAGLYFTSIRLKYRHY